MNEYNNARKGTHCTSVRALRTVTFSVQKGSTVGGRDGVIQCTRTSPNSVRVAAGGLHRHGLCGYIRRAEDGSLGIRLRVSL